KPRIHMGCSNRCRQDRNAMAFEIEIATLSALTRTPGVHELLTIDRMIGKPYLEVPRIYNSQAWSRRLELPWAIARLEPVSGSSILDVGSGDSALPIYLARRGAQVTSVDPSARHAI